MCEGGCWVPGCEDVDEAFVSMEFGGDVVFNPLVD